MIELRMGDGYYLVLYPNYEKRTTVAYIHRYGQIQFNTQRDSIKSLGELEGLIDMMKEKMNGTA